MRRLLIKLGFIALSAGLSGCATTAPPSAAISRDSVRTSTPADENSIAPAATLLANSAAHAVMPPGFFSFCLRQPDQCPEAADPNLTVAMTEPNWQAIEQVNHAVNAAIWPETDERHYGREEYWTIPVDGYGDCEDYALTKRKQLSDVGFPMAALRIAVVDAPREGRHAVLTVTTDKGDYVLDNLTDDILPWNRTGYTWIERQDPAHPQEWAALDISPRHFADAGSTTASR